MEFYIITTLFLGANGVLFEPVNNNMGIMYTDLAKTYTYYTQWHLCYYYDLGLYYEQIHKLELCVKQMNDICSNIDNDDICKITTTMFKTDLDNIRQNNEAMRKMHIRQKRAPLEFIGKLNNMLFGIMDAETARKYDEKINELQSETEINRKMAKEKTTLLKGFIELNNRTFNNFRDNIFKLESQMQKLQGTLGVKIDEVMIGDQFRDISSVATLIVMDHNELSNQIKFALEESMSGGITNLIPIHNLEKDMNDIQVDENQALPTQLKDNGFFNIKNFVTTRAALYNEKLFMEIGIPVVDKRQYNLFKAISIPMQIRNETLIMTPTSKYFLLNSSDNLYIQITEKDLRACLHFDEETLICKPTSPVYHNPKKVCELAMFTKESPDVIDKACVFRQVPKTNYVIQINEQDKYFLSITSPIAIVNSCGDGRVEMSKIDRNGILTVESNCVISTNDFQIRPHEHKYFNDTKIIMPDNDIHNLKFEKNKRQNATMDNGQDAILIQNYETEFGELANRANELIEKESTEIKLENIHYDTVTHSYFIFILIAIVVILAAVAAFIIYTKVHPLSNLLSMITGLPVASEEGENHRNVIINVGRRHDSENTVEAV